MSYADFAVGRAEGMSLRGQKEKEKICGLTPSTNLLVELFTGSLIRLPKLKHKYSIDISYSIVVFILEQELILNALKIYQATQFKAEESIMHQETFEEEATFRDARQYS